MKIAPSLLSLAFAPFRDRAIGLLAIAALSAVGSTGCESCTIGNPRDAGSDARSPFTDGGFVCFSEDVSECLGNVHYSCRREGEFLAPVIDDCSMRTDGRNTCVRELGCSVCRPNTSFCNENDVVTCNTDGSDFTLVEECDVSAGYICRDAMCINEYDDAIMNRSYQGCEFYTVDLDNAAIALGSDAASQQYAVVVSNPGGVETEVIVERNNAPVGMPVDLEEVERVTLLPGDLEVLNLARREVDGSSSFYPCDMSAQCGVGESCFCAGGLTAEDPPPTGGHRDCRCRVVAGSNGLDDGTHSALTSNAYRVTSVHPIIAYQFNPLDNVGVFSNDASLLLPTSAIGREYLVVGWPQTIANSVNPNEDFDPTDDDEDLRAFLTIVGTQPGTHVSVQFANDIRNVIGIDGAPNAVGGELWEFDIGPFDVINLETQGFNADFTGTTISTNDASRPVSVFIGSEASDAPRFNIIQNRQCCADHLEEQVFPRDTLGEHFFIGRMPPRSVALNAAFVDPTRDSVGEFNEPEFVRIHAAAEGTTVVTTTLPPPRDSLMLTSDGLLCPDDGNGTGCRSFILIANQDFEILADQAISVMQVLPSQEAVGIINQYPGGDPALIAVPPVEQYRDEYVFLTPNLYAFDFVVITAPFDATLELDGENMTSWLADERCKVAPADGIPRRVGDPDPEWVVYRCQFSFPDVVGLPNVQVQDGIQHDGYHSLRASKDVGLVVYGFDAFVSYAYAGGLNLDVIR